MSISSPVVGPVVQTDLYEGPLDLLLHLVQRDGIDVCSLPLVDLTREYLAVLEDMRLLDLDLAGEFLVMAALLCELKSREFLPRTMQPAQEDEEEDPRMALARRILEYRRYRQAAEELEQRSWLGRDVFARPPHEQDPSERELLPDVDALGLLEILEDLRRRRAAPPPVHDVEAEPVRWVDCLQGVMTALDDGEPRPLDEILAAAPSRPARILTFIAVLELCRLQALQIRQQRHLETIVLQGTMRASQLDLSAMAEAL